VHHRSTRRWPSARQRRLELAYKQHAVVDDVRGIVLDVEVATGETDDRRDQGQVVIERRRSFRHRRGSAALFSCVGRHGSRRPLFEAFIPLLPGFAPEPTFRF
jgi:hypothetical protein